MKNQIKLNAFYILIAMLLFNGCDFTQVTQNSTQSTNGQEPVPGSTTQASMASEASEVIPGQYIVVFKDQAEGVISEQAALEALQRTQSVLSDNDIGRDSLLFEYQYALKGFSAKLTLKQVERLKNDPRVKRVTPARMFRVGIAGGIENKSNSSTFSAENMQSGQTIPWGVTRVGGPLDGTGETAWIIDSGIDLDHPDLNVDTGNSASFIADETADDNFGHGTYVAGILAAKDNGQDIVGVAAGATVVSINVCDENGSCPEPEYLNGIDYVANQATPGDIVNISIWGPTDPDVDDAVTTAANNGVRLVLIAGNGSADANNYSPGRINHSNIWTISAYDDTDSFASFSNYGNPPIEYGGPGVDVPSLRIGGGWGMGFDPSLTGDEDGTSYAAPHIAGLLLAAPGNISINGYVSGDPDSNPDPIAVATPPLSVTISGSTVLESGQQGTWTANVENVFGTISYQWFYKNDNNDSWHAAGNDTDTFSWTFFNNGSSIKLAYVRVDIASAGDQASDTYGVSISAAECEPHEIQC